jgi:hypothetical protein
MEHDARALLRSLEGRTIPTITGELNTILEIRETRVLVGTVKSPRGEWVLITIVQDGLDELASNGEVQVSAKRFRFRSAFVGAVLAALPGVVTMTQPARVRLAPELGPSRRT